MMSILIIINDALYGTEKAFNALRLAMTLQKQTPKLKLRIFLLADHEMLKAEMVQVAEILRRLLINQSEKEVFNG
jgi:sulfur relay (sulfurtransferase) complex TusBCD TusD component (DsrE family)